MDPRIFLDPPISNNEERASPVLPHSEVIARTKPQTKEAPGGEDCGALHQLGNLMSGTASGKFYAPGAFQKSTHLPTPRSPGSMMSHHLTRNPIPNQSLQSDVESTTLPTEFRSYASPSPSVPRPYSFPTPESSPLVAWSRSSGPHSSSRGVRTNYDDGSMTPSKRVSTPPRTPSRQTLTRPITPVLQSRPNTPLQQRPTEQLSRASAGVGSLRSDDSAASRLLRNVKDELEVETARIRAQLIENHLVSTQAAELRLPDYLKRMRRPTSSGSAGAGGASLTSDLGDQDGSLLWSSANVGVIESPVKGKRIALFQETSEESFEESLMAGGYGRYRSDRPWKLDEDAEVPNQVGDAMGEEEFGPGLVLKEDEKRKKSRLAAFLDPPWATSSAQLFPVEIKGCGRVLMKVEPSEPQTPPKPTPKAKRSRKRKKASADMKQDADNDSVAAPEGRAVDGPNWPDTEFPWRSRAVAQDGLSGVEREERLRHIESFLDRESDEDDAEERRSSPSRRSPDEGPSRSPRLGRGKSYPLLSHSKDHRHDTIMLSVIPSDPADARTALLSKKSIRAVQLRLLRRHRTDRRADSDDGKVLCACRGRDDGRPLVQCDACRTWYHLECIGIQSTSELGREEDPWFCANCAEVKTPPPVVVPLTEPTFASMNDDEPGTGQRDGTDMEGYDPPFFNAGLNPSPATPWTRSVKAPKTPPRTQYAQHSGSGSSWDEAPSSSSHGDPRTPQFNTASAFGDMVRVYGMTPGRSLEASSTAKDESPFDPTSTPSRGIRFGLPFMTPKDGKWGSSLWQGGRGSEWFHTPKHPGEDSSVACLRHGQPLLYQGRVGDASEGPSGVPGLLRATGPTNVTPVERELLGLKRMQLLESPLGVKRSKRRVDS